MRETLEKKNEKEKIEERREATERERKKEKEKKFNKRREGNLIKYFFFLASCYSAHLFIDVHCSKKLKKFRYISTVAACILVELK